MTLRALTTSAESLASAMEGRQPQALAQARALVEQARAALVGVAETAGYRLASQEDVGLAMRHDDLTLVWGTRTLSLAWRPSGGCQAQIDATDYFLTPQGECLGEDAIAQRLDEFDEEFEGKLESLPTGSYQPGPPGDWEKAAREAMGIAGWTSLVAGLAKAAEASVRAEKKERAPSKPERPRSQETIPACRSCQAELMPGARFCSLCGKPTEAACAGCGVKLPAHAKFCHDCGAPAS